ncbi:hypothetical protein FBU31_004751, partial [Coemansia sp. 'formosensis']
ASVVHGAQHLDAGDALHRRQVGVVPPVVGVVTSSTLSTPVAAPGAVIPTSTPISSTAAPGAISTPTLAIPITSSTAKPAPPAAILAAPSHSSTTLASSSVAKPAAPQTTPTPVVPTPTPTPTSTSKTSPAGGGVPALGGGGGSPQTGTPEPANVFTATMGSGAALDYGSCITFESQCNSLCSYGIYSMDCVTGGICLCYSDDPKSTTPDPNGNAALGPVGGGSGAASRHLLVWNASVLVLPALAALFLSATFF